MSENEVRLPGPALSIDTDGEPIIYKRALAIYDYMLANLEASMYDDDYQQYKGRLTDEVEAELGISLSQYSRSMNLLKMTNAVEQVGRSNEGSHWVLYRRPTYEDFDNVRKNKYISARKPTKQDVLLQRIEDLISVVSEHEERISHLERMLDGED